MPNPKVNSNGHVDLTKRALLVGLSISRWEPWITDEKVSKDVNAEYNTHRNAGHYRKRLLRPEALLRVTSATNAIRKKFDTLSLPWSDEGWRIVSGKGYFKVQQDVGVLIQEFNAAADEFFDDYEKHIRDAEQWMKNDNGKSNATKVIFDRANYPVKSLIRAKFEAKIDFKNLPSGEDFRVDLGGTEMAKIAKLISDKSRTDVETGMKDIYARFQVVIKHMVERLKAYNDSAEERSTFRDTLVTNITDLLDVVPLLNITGDAKVVEFSDKVKKQLTAFGPDTLREDSKVRDSVAAKAEQLLKGMSDLLA